MNHNSLDRMFILILFYSHLFVKWIFHPIKKSAKHGMPAAEHEIKLPGLMNRRSSLCIYASLTFVCSIFLPVITSSTAPLRLIKNESSRPAIPIPIITRYVSLMPLMEASITIITNNRGPFLTELRQKLNLYSSFSIPSNSSSTNQHFVV